VIVWLNGTGGAAEVVDTTTTPAPAVARMIVERVRR